MYTICMAFVFLIIFLLGISLGSFLNVLIDRLPQGEDVVHGRSHCDHCKRTICWYELIPVLSWMLQGGKSRCCHKKLSFQYPFIELTIGIGCVVLYLLFFGLIMTMSLPYLGAVLLLCSAVGIFVADLKTERIPTVFLYGGFFGTLLLLSPRVLLCVNGSKETCFELLNIYVLPAVLGAGFFFVLWLFSKGRAMGDGDIYLAGIIGLALGYPKLVIAYYVSFLTGAIVGVILILVRKKRMNSHISFGPFLVIGLGMTYIYGSAILTWWSHLW